MHSLGKWLLLIIAVLAFVEFSLRPSAKEKMIVELIDLHCKIEQGKTQFEDIGDNLNDSIIFFNNRIFELSQSLSPEERELLPKEIELIQINCP